ncbi:MAG: hypothetical protein AAF641_17375 [Pseudomonadota bacterium]
MSALFKMEYTGAQGFGAGALYVGRGRIVGLDVLGGEYRGQYTNIGRRLRGTVTLSSASNSLQLVTGQTLGPGQAVEIALDWPENLDTGTHKVTVSGAPVHVQLTKIDDIP